MIRFILFAGLLLPFIPVRAEEWLKGNVTDKKGYPVTGATVHWKNTPIISITDENGAFSILSPDTLKILHITCPGFIEKEIDTEEDFRQVPFNIQLEASFELDEVVISERKPGTLIPRTSLLHTQRISSDELIRAACCNLGESFETNPSVDVSYSDAVTGARQIRLLGLAGTYVQMLSENSPSVRGLAAPYGLDYIPGPWMESIQVSKGTSSVKNGYEAITGQINVEYKKPPVADPFSANVFVADNGRYELNTDGALLINDKLSSGLFLHYSNEMAEHDNNDDGFMDTPLKHQFNIMNRWHYIQGKFISQTYLSFLNEKRYGGQTTRHSGNIHPDELYETFLKTNRFQFTTKNGYITRPEINESIALITSGSYHDNDSYFGHRIYNARQKNLYLSVMYEREFTKTHHISTGISFNYDGIRQEYQQSYITSVSNDEKINESTPGLYTQYTFNKDDRFIILAGIRADYNSQYDLFVTPRLHVKYNLADWAHLRASAGKGFRTTYILPEYNYYLASNRRFEILTDKMQEEAWNYGINLSFYIPVADRELTIQTEWYYTDFKKQVVADVDSDPHKVLFYELNGSSYSSNMQIEAIYPFFRGFTLTAAYRLTDSKTTYEGNLKKKPLVNDYKGLVTASYQTPLKKWQFDLTGQFNGGGRMPNPHDNLWKDTFRPYTVVHAQVTKFFRTWSVYLGSENLLDFRQKNPIIASENPWGEDFDATMVWGPVHGRKLYMGIRYNLSRI